jgi:erythromycin esterase
MRASRSIRLPAVLLLLAVPVSELAAQEAGGTEPMVLRPDTTISLPLPADALHRFTLPVPAGTLLRLHLEPFPSVFSFRVLDGDGAVVTDAGAWCSYDDSACVIPLVAGAPGDYTVEVRPVTADFPRYRDDYPADVSYRLRLELAPSQESEAVRAQLPAVLAWTRAAAHPLQAVTAGSGFEDLQPLRGMLEGVRVVGLGEATHGSREFFQLKHRLLQFLVEEMGFTHFAMESDGGAARVIDDFVVHGRGTRAEALAAGRMWQWDTEEVAELLDWLLEHNRQLPEHRRVRFAGFDFQVNERGKDVVVGYLRRVDPARATAADTALAPLARQPDPTRMSFFVDFYAFTPEQKAVTTAAVHELVEHLAAHRDRFIDATSPAEYEEAEEAMRRMMQFTDAHSRTGYDYAEPESGLATRDRYMAENILRLLERAGAAARIAVWSHNGHVRLEGYRMGHYLRQRLGDAYFAFGLAFDRGSFRALDVSEPAAYPVRDFSIGPAAQESIGWYLKRVGIGDLFVDLRHAPSSGPVADWLGRAHPLRSIGNGFSPVSPLAAWGYGWPPVVPSQAFDGLFFVERVTAARGNAGDQQP